MKRTTISVFGNFGTQNLGNECTLQALIRNVHKYLPDAQINCICINARDASARHNIPAFPMSYRYANDFKSKAQSGKSGPILRLLRRLLIRLPLELFQWVEAFRKLRSTSMLVMAGTGMLGDFGIGPFDLHYEILKWSIAAKARRSKLLFLSVGAGPIAHPLSRWLVKSAISLADYRSYRDTFSKEYLTSIGFNTRDDLVYPDLAFSLRPESPGSTTREGSSRVIGLGLMDYFGQGIRPGYDEPTYRNYLAKVTSFVVWLLERKYTVRLLIGDVSYDTRIKRDLIEMLKERRLRYPESQIIDEPVSSVEELVAQLAGTDIVIATRFHNILLALMLNKPVVALSYHEKTPSLMAALGLAEYWQSIDRLDVDLLVEQFIKVEQNIESLKPLLERKTDEYRTALDRQYAHIFNHLDAGSPRT